MSIFKAFLLVSVCAWSGAAPPLAKAPVAPLLAGESLAVSGPDGVVHAFGAAARERPMGSLARLVWLKLEGNEWGSMGLQFNCTGAWKGERCWWPKGHGKVDLSKALAQDCDLAFLAWGQASVQWWLRDYGDGAARARLEDAFSPFLGNRMPPGEGLPAIDAPWAGAGDFLRASPEAILRWLMDPAQDETLRLLRRHLLSFTQYNHKQNAWWILTGTSVEAGSACTWVVGGDGQILAVLLLPPGSGRPEGLARFRTVLMVSDK